METWDKEIIKCGDQYVHVVRIDRTVGVFTCNEKGMIIPPGIILMLSHIENPKDSNRSSVAYHHVVEKMKKKAACSIEYYTANSIYGAMGCESSKFYSNEETVGSRIYHKMEVVDSLKRYDDNFNEIIYVDAHEYEKYDGNWTPLIEIEREHFIEMVKIWFTDEE